jgi:uncharacterized membrane protein YidH (DUF202 family)
MLKFLKYIPLVAMGKNVSTAYKEETGKERPAYLSRRFIGAALALAGGIAAVQFGIKIDDNIIASVTDNLDKLIAAGIALYGAIVLIIGIFKKQKTPAIEKTQAVPATPEAKEPEPDIYKKITDQASGITKEHVDNLSGISPEKTQDY